MRSTGEATLATASELKQFRGGIYRTDQNSMNCVIEFRRSALQLENISRAYIQYVHGFLGARWLLSASVAGIESLSWNYDFSDSGPYLLLHQCIWLYARAQGQQMETAHAYHSSGLGGARTTIRSISGVILILRTSGSSESIAVTGGAEASMCPLSSS
jgi:hypothetical protein